MRTLPTCTFYIVQYAHMVHATGESFRHSTYTDRQFNFVTTSCGRILQSHPVHILEAHLLYT